MCYFIHGGSLKTLKRILFVPGLSTSSEKRFRPGIRESEQAEKTHIWTRGCGEQSGKKGQIEQKKNFEGRGDQILHCTSVHARLMKTGRVSFTSTCKRNANKETR